MTITSNRSSVENASKYVSTIRAWHCGCFSWKFRITAGEPSSTTCRSNRPAKMLAVNPWPSPNSNTEPVAPTWRNTRCGYHVSSISLSKSYRFSPRYAATCVSSVLPIRLTYRLSAVSFTSNQLVTFSRRGADLFGRIEHHHVDDREPRYEFSTELGVLERHRPNELKLDATRAEFIPGVERHSPARIDVGVRSHLLAQRKH